MTSEQPALLYCAGEPAPSGQGLSIAPMPVPLRIGAVIAHNGAMTKTTKPSTKAAPKPAAAPAPAKTPRQKTGGTPMAVRQQKTLAELRRLGGDKVCVNMPGPTFSKLAPLQEKLGTANRSETIIAAIEALAKRLLK